MKSFVRIFNHPICIYGVNTYSYVRIIYTIVVYHITYIYILHTVEYMRHRAMYLVRTYTAAVLVHKQCGLWVAS